MTNKEWLFARPNIEIVRTFQGCPPGKTYSRQKCESADCEECFARWLDEEHKEPLKPCPFCGGENIKTLEGGCYPAFVQCAECNATVFANEDDDTIKNAIEKWNRMADNV